MTSPPVPQVSTRTARILHAALCVSAVSLALLLSVVRAAMPPFEGAPQALLRYITLGALVVDLLIARRFRAAIPPLPAGGDSDAWWRAHLGRAIVVWALVESAVVLGAVVHFATGDFVPLAAAGVAIVVLWGDRPSRLLRP